MNSEIKGSDPFDFLLHTAEVLLRLRDSGCMPVLARKQIKSSRSVASRNNGGLNYQV